MRRFSFHKLNPNLVKGRRLAFLCANLCLIALAAIPMAALFAHHERTPLGAVLWVINLLLIAQVTQGFSLAATGFWLLCRKGDPVRINNTLPPDFEKEALPPTAIVMPVFNEDVGHVFQGLRSIWESLDATGHGKDFDLFILSDSNDPNSWVAEEVAWLELCKRVNGFGRIFYRKRRIGLNHKSGNIADFCRRWGANYRYMIVVDADSVMTGPLLVRLVNLMERNPKTGILQTSPHMVLGKSLFQRIMQFNAGLCEAIFSAGANYWQMSSANFWGHNAIIRVKPFMDHCAIPELPAKNPLGNRVMSHDTIEAALMQRAGCDVWFAYDLEGSYEAGPPDLLSGVKRHQRWCFGNMQHIWFLFARGFRPASRIHIFNGIMNYAASPLWLFSLLLGTAVVLTAEAPAIPSPERIPSMPSGGGWLFAYVMGLLLLPKALGMILLLRSPKRLEAFGGGGRVALSVLGETLFSMILAPILMLFYTRFVWASLTGTRVKWGGQARDSEAPPAWRELLSAHLGHTCIAVVWTAAVAWLKPAFLPWIAPIVLGPLISIPFSYFSASRRLGAKTRSRGLFLIPEETNPPPELRKAEEPFTEEASPFLEMPQYATDRGLLLATLDPYINAIHVSLLHHRDHVNIRNREYLKQLASRLLIEGPSVLTPAEKQNLLWDADSMVWAHQALWTSSASQLHEWWQTAMRHYNESSTLAERRMAAA